MSKVIILNDIELQRLKRKCAGFTPELLKEFATALKNFCSSNRYLFFRNLRIAEIIPNPGENLEEYSFGDLVELGVVRVCDLKGVEDGIVRRLMDILNQFAEGDEAEEAPEASEEDLLLLVQASGNPEMVAALQQVHPDVPVYGSVDAEKKISEGFSRLIGSPRYSELQSEKMDRFWGKDLIRAPFIEALTIHELVSLRVDDLLKKRSFGNVKIHALLQAIDRCLEVYGEKEIAGRQQPQEFAAHAGADRMQEVRDTQVNEENSPESSEGTASFSEDLPLVTSLAIVGLEQMSRNQARSNSEKILYRLVQEEGAGSLLEEFLRQEEPHLCEEKSSESTAGLSTELEHAVCRVTEEIWPELLGAWRGLLASAAVSEEQLFVSFYQEQPARQLQRALFRLLLMGLGAALPSDGGRELSGHWTLSPGAFERVAISLRDRDCSDDDLRQDIQALLPQAEVDGVFAFLCAAAERRS